MDLTLGDLSYRIDDPVVIEERISSWAFDRGYVFPIEGDGRTVGALFVAEGTWTVRFERPSDALVTANRLAVLERVDPADLQRVVHDSALIEAVDRGWMLDNTLWSEIRPALQLVDQRGPVLVSPSADAAEEVLVVGDRSLQRARRIAEETLRERVVWMRKYAFDPGSLVAAGALQPEEVQARVAEFRTAQAWDRFAGETALGTDQRWLAYVRDPSGAFDRQYRAVVVAQGIVEERLVRAPVARERFPADRDGIRRAPHRVELVTASATASWDREGTGGSLVAEVVADLRVQAVGGPAHLVWLDVPHVEQQPEGAHPPLAEGWSLLLVATTDGRPLVAHHLPLTSDQTDGRGHARTYAAVLPAPLPEGETLDLRVSWRDRHRFVHQGGGVAPTRGMGGEILFADNALGVTTEPVPALPTLRTAAGPPGPARIRVGVRPWVATLDRVAVSGVRQGTQVEGGYRYVEAATTTAQPTMSVGQWREGAEGSKQGFPAVRSLFRAQGSVVPKQLPVEVRSVLHGWDPMLPPYPAGEVQLAELYASPTRMGLWLAGDGLIPVQPVHVLGTVPRTRRIMPHVERWMVATGLHGHWWTATGSPPGVDGVDRAVAAVYGTKTLGARYGVEVEDAWFDYLRVQAAAADRKVDGWSAGAFVLGRTLTDQVGDAALFEAVDRALQGEFPPTRDGLQAALEATTGRDLGAFFDLWLRAGISPDVRASFTQDHNQVEVSLTCDVPFASFTVPVRLVGRGFDRDATVDVDQGVGRASVKVPGVVRRVLVDPDRRLLLRRNDAL